MCAQTSKQHRLVKSERFDLRIPAETKAIIKRAAELRGMNSSDFVISAAYDAAQATIIGHQTMTLNRQQTVRVAESLIDPPEPNEALKSLVGSASAKE